MSTPAQERDLMVAHLKADLRDLARRPSQHSGAFTKSVANRSVEMLELLLHDLWAHERAKADP